jgi:F-type H+-transporting ATPase subunit delta
MAISSPISRRYARALIEAASKDGPAGIERAAGELERMLAVLNGSAELRGVLANPVFTPGQRDQVLKAVTRRLGLSELVARFLDVLIRAERIGEIAPIARAVRRMADLRAGRVRAEVQSAAPLSDDAITSLRLALERRTGKTVEIELKVDPTLLGGVRTRIGSMVIDGTLRSQLDSLREGLLRSE